MTPEIPTAEQYGVEMTFDYISAYAESHPEDVEEYVEPSFDMPELTEEQLTAARIAELEAGAQKLLPAIQAGIDVEYNQQRLVDCMLEIERLKGNI